MKKIIRSADAAPILGLICLLMNIPAILTAYNYIYKSEEPKTAFFISVLLGIFIFEYLFFEIIIFPIVYKPLVAIVFYFNLIVLYFMLHYKVVVDKDVAISFSQTTLGETSEYMTTPYTLLLIFGFLGLLWISLKFKIVFSSAQQEFKRKGLTICILFFLLGLNISLFFKDYAFFFREQKVFKHLLLPLNYLDAIYGGIQKSVTSNQVLHDIHSSARLNPSFWKSESKKTVYVLILGETARAQSFSLDGYLKKTNPHLETVENLVSFLRTSSCGTSTSVSVPCIFDFRGREKFVSSNEHFTNLLDIAKKSGFYVSWLDNNTGCQHVCDRVQEVNIRDLPEAKVLCQKDGNCYDELLFYGLKKTIESSSEKKNFIILHTLGSHGPKYYKRYPPEMAHFQPDCHQNDLANCTNQQIVNSYDNTIYYTDFVLAKIIDYLKKLKNVNSNFIYISDHGESLGEKGLYLHAMPFRFAPEEQTHVPFLFWANASFLKDFHFDIECIKKEKNLTLSHDHIFHSYLRLMGIESPNYIQERDLFKNCTTTDPERHSEYTPSKGHL